MKIIKGNYLKENNSERQIEILVLENKDDGVKGIDLTLLTEIEQEEIKQLRMDYEEKTKKYMKAFRYFKRDKIKRG